MCVYIYASIVSDPNVKSVRIIFFLRHFGELTLEPGRLMPNALGISNRLLVVEGSQLGLPGESGGAVVGGEVKDREIR